MNDLQQHLTFIQNVITRMASNSFAIKALTITLTTALIALMVAQRDPKAEILIAGILPVFVFWFLDAKYLQLERLFRKLYDGVRTGAITDKYTMDINQFLHEVASVPRIAFSWSVLWFYLVATVALVGVYFVIIG